MSSRSHTDHYLLRCALRAISRPSETLDKVLVRIVRRTFQSGRLQSSSVPWGESTASLGLKRLIEERFYDSSVGRSYGVQRKEKEKLVERFKASTVQIPSATAWPLHVALAHQVLCLSPELKGDVIECGCYKGSSTASLSLTCKLAGRRLWVCDSFQGLPAEEAPQAHEYPHLQVYGHYEKGMYAGRLEEVKENVKRHGELSVCRFVPGFFCDSLKELKGPFVFAFLDVDLVSSMRDCIRYIWPLMADGAYIFTDDSLDMEVVRVWFDDDWWQRALGERSPGYVGSGCGLPLTPDVTSLGYARKLADPVGQYHRVPWLRYPGSEAGAGEEGGPQQARSRQRQ